MGQSLIDWLVHTDVHPDTSPGLWTALLAAVQVTANYSLSSRDLRRLLSLLRSNLRAAKSPTQGKIASDLLRLLRSVGARDGPADFFHLGGAGSGILRVAPLKSPQRGYAVGLWVRSDYGYKPPPPPVPLSTRTTTAQQTLLEERRKSGASFPSSVLPSIDCFRSLSF